ncbi:RHS repeat-associated core domain-containing protein [Cellulomonas wangsupingiae]|uniref:RHS repeat-associated core domain-containing protein n=1 Tax=Cellulomonas wangsupingiae TaxID=2968085 RepID=A0ABY5K8H1_9CELL|nr:RHS repeat-associated core domain-containing protein [Cellulomonas wangsupingiae]MCC2334863.1 RHS repeat-associated core domain-containing protein [Cellulomonas wangsupingiae]MCM0638736.1 RHS repeat-associated core domain-containing protein [Cellulomonas wangsupingiae]UUI65365.1 RHS repeat-associated core domain-containing protein [Cellulomonas wangsupingiae]
MTSDADYDPYGRPEAPTSDPTAQVTRFGYAGEYTDPTGYVYLRARYYDPTSAQFLTRDPLEATTANPYGYTDGNPLQHTDPLGLDWLQDAGDWSAAFGDTITLGATKWVRGKLGVDDAVNYCSTFYTWGGVGGGIASVAPVGAASLGLGRAVSWVAGRSPAIAAGLGRAGAVATAGMNRIATAVSARVGTALAYEADRGAVALGRARALGDDVVLARGGATPPIALLVAQASM